MSARAISPNKEVYAEMRITPKLALSTTAILVAVGLLWLGFVEGGRSQISSGQGSQVSGVAGQFPNQLIAAGTMTAWAVPGIAETGASPATSQPQDNVPALALGGSVIASLVMLAVAFARFQAVHPPVVSGDSGMAAPRRNRLVTSGTPQL